MATISMDPRLGPFAPDQQAPIPLARGAFGLGISACAIAVARPLIENIARQSDLAWLRVPGMGIAVAAILLSLAAFYRVSTQGLRGRGLSLGGMWLGVAAAVTSVIYAATVDGSLRLGRFAFYYLNGRVLLDVIPDLARAAVNTVKAAFLAEVFAVVVGLIIATFRISKRRMVRLPAVAYIDVVRGLPLVVLVSLVGGGLPFIGITLSSLTVVVLSLTINASAYVAEIFRAGIQALPRGQMDAARSLGMTQGAAMTSVVIPQAFRAVIPPLMNEFIALIKDTAIAYAIVGATVASRDMFTAAQQFAGATFSPTPYIAVSIGYLIITIPLTRLVGLVERRLRTGLV
jgi:polar amino acid transport system permease protein